VPMQKSHDFLKSRDFNGALHLHPNRFKLVTVEIRDL
jgi:hypothetical protein